MTERKGAGESMGSKAFCGEVWTNVHPEIMAAMASCNQEAVDGKVGNDGFTKRAEAYMKAEFEKEVFINFTYNGTAANILALKSMLRPWGSVLSADCTHINTYECGATEYMLGNKILTLPSEDGKLSATMIEEYLQKIKNFKYLPEVLVVTQPTELGVLYTNEELKALCDYAHSKKMVVYLDGARITNALAALETDLHSMIEETGIDAFSFGGTKAGLCFGEMVVFLREEFAENMAYSQKQSLQHMDKSKFLGVQFEYLLKTGLWKKNANHANGLAKELEKKLSEKGLSAYYPVDTNMVFCSVTPAQYERITAHYDLHYWEEEKGLLRFCTTHETTQELIDHLASLV